MEENAKNIETAPVPPSPSSGTETVDGKAKKPRKAYEWTPKRKEAFDKMREALDTKISLTKQLKEEKRKAEKEAIKSKVREIMASKKKGSMPVVESESSSDSSISDDSSVEPPPKPKKKSEKEKTKKDKKSRKHVEISEDSESESLGSNDTSDEEPMRERRVASRRQRSQVRRDKQTRGKAVRRAQFLNPMDQFILL